MSARRLLSRAGAVLATSATLGLVLWAGGLAPHPWPAAVLFCLAIGLVVVALGWTLMDHVDELPAASWFGAEPQDPPPLRAGADHRLGRLRHLLRDTCERDDRPDQLYPILRDLTADRLAARGVDLDADPEAARAVMPPSLARYLAHPPEGTRPVSRRALTDVVARIEEL